MKQFEYMTPETVVKTYEDAKTGYTTANGRLERVEKFDTLLDGNAARSKIKDFRTALYPRQYHPSVLEKPLYSAVFRLQGVFPPRMSAEKQKMQHNRRKSRL